MSSQLLQSPTDLHALDLIRRRLSMVGPLSQADHALIEDGCHTLAPAPPGADLGADGELHFLVGGWACHVRDLGPGQTQILGFILPGDAINPVGRSLPPLHRAVALTRVWLTAAGPVSRQVREKPQTHAGLASVLSALAQEEHGRHLDHAVRLGALNAYQAMRHFLNELQARLAKLNLTQGARFDLPVAQDVLGDALGISEVHANRVLAQMRREGLLELGPGWASLSAQV